ncbi:Mov34/MPN/PAD-1 family protein [Anaerobacillus sp. MEB173]|uniref:Mov34/MPN/PAD-1 family protein n=1 Tax=Anaerobacillus sp. MEB173 TaxID=3383345 RepID=UPI003F931BAD
MIFLDKHYEKMIKHCRYNLPFEVCGMLAGKKNKVESIWELESEVRSKRHYFVDKKIVERTLEEISKQNETVLAIYHSHPTAAPVPSYDDIVYHPDSKIFMIIISFKTKVPKVKCYSVRNGKFKECSILIKPNF